MGRLAWLAGLLNLALTGLAAQDRAAMLTLAEAEQLALRNHPRAAAARLLAEAALETPRQTRALLAPVISGHLTGSVAENGTRLGAGQLNPSSLFSRTATGFSINQVLWDFGRVRALSASFDARAAGAADSAGAIRAEIRLRVRDAYFRRLMAEAQLEALRQNLETRRLTQRQIAALVSSNLRSTLDLSFADLAAAEAELALNRAESDVRAGDVDLSAALGLPAAAHFLLRDEPDPEAAPDSPEALVASAIDSRPDVRALRQQVRAARSFAESEQRLSRPTLSAAGVAGMFGPSDANLRQRYGAVGVNLSIPLFNGGQFASRRTEAQKRAEAAQEDLRDLELRVGRDVRLVLVEVQNARQRLELTAKVLDQANRTLRLAQTRYDLGLGTILELATSQLSRTTAEVSARSARYEVLIRQAQLDFQLGRIR